jgi:serine/threonine-protein kinase
MDMPLDVRPSLPPEVLLSGVRRLRLLAGVLFALQVLALLFFARASRPLIGAGMGAALAMIAVTHARRLSAEQILAIGTVFQVIGAFIISLNDYTAQWTAGQITRGVPGATVWVMAFPLVPSTLRRSALTAFAAAATGPAALALAAALGRSIPEPQVAAMFYLPLFIGAALSTLASGAIYRLAVDASRAQQLGSYQLVEKIAEGGMGEVWRARHGSLVRPAAVKLIRPEMLGHKSTGEMISTIRRFEREAQSTASLSSPHTVALYDFGRTTDGTFYYVMELLGGLNLESLVGRFGPLPAERAVHILRQMCDSLAEAHRIGLVHRDIKPENAQLTVYGGEFDFVKVLDFGLVRRRSEPRSPLITADRALVGTPAYLAPESTLGSRATDERSDLYALGCVAYWLITGKLVFDETTPMAMVLAHAQATPTPPSQRTELPIPPELERLVLDLLAKDPEDRPANAGEVARRLDAVPVLERWTQGRAERWWRAHLPEETRRLMREDEETQLSAAA